MALQTQIVDIPLTGGLSENVDDVLIEPGTFLALDNFVYTKSGALQKRSGFGQLQFSIESVPSTSNTMRQAVWLGQMGASRLIAAPGQGSPCSLFSEADGLFAFIERQPIASGVGTRSRGIRSTKIVSHPKLVSVLGETGKPVTVWTWEYSQDSLFLRVTDDDTGATIVTDRKCAALYPASSTGVEPDGVLINVGGVAYHVCISHGTGTGIFAVMTYNPPSGFNTPIAVVTPPNPVKCWAACAIDNTRFVIVWAEQTACAVTFYAYVASIGVGGISGTLYTIGSSFAPTVLPTSVSVCTDGTNVWFPWAGTNGSTTYDFRYYRFIANTGAVSIHGDEIASTYRVERQTCVRAGSSIWFIANCDSVSGAGMAAGDYAIACTAFSTNAFPGDPPTITRSIFYHGILISDAFAYAPATAVVQPYFWVGVNYAALADNSRYSLRPVLLRISDDTTYSPDEWHVEGYFGSDCLGDPFNGHVTLGNDRPQGVHVALGNLDSFQAAVFVEQDAAGHIGIDRMAIDWSPASKRRMSTISEQDGITFSGALPQVWDGDTVSEAAFLGPPVAETTLWNDLSASGPVTPSTTASGTKNVGVVMHWEWIDERGRVFRSELMGPYFVAAVAPSGSFTGALFFVQNLFASNLLWRANRTRRYVRLALYTTDPNLNIYYRRNTPISTDTVGVLDVYDATSPDSPAGNQQVLEIIYDLSAANQPKYGILYTEPLFTVLENEPPPPSLFVHAHGERQWLISGIDPRQIWFSKELIFGEAPAWSSVNFLRLESSVDAAVALATLDSTLVALTPSRIYEINGDGPNDTGGGGEFSVDRITSDVGCGSPKSVVEFAGGVVFQAPNGAGFYLLGRDKSVSYISASIQDIAQQYPDCVGSALDPARQWMLFLLRKVSFVVDVPPAAPFNIYTYRMVLFDYRHSAWSTWTVNDGQAGNAISGPTTLWPQGFAYDSSSSGAASISVEGQDPFAPQYDTNGAPVGALTTPWLKLGSVAGYERARWLMLTGRRLVASEITVQIARDYGAAIADAATWNTANTATPPLAGLPVVKVDHHLAVQRCAAIQVVLTDQDFATKSVSTTPVSGMRIEGISLEVGVKRGRNKIPQNNRG